MESITWRLRPSTLTSLMGGWGCPQRPAPSLASETPYGSVTLSLWQEHPRTRGCGPRDFQVPGDRSRVRPDSWEWDRARTGAPRLGGRPGPAEPRLEASPPPCTLQTRRRPRPPLPPSARDTPPDEAVLHPRGPRPLAPLSYSGVPGALSPGQGQALCARLRLSLSPAKGTAAVPTPQGRFSEDELVVQHTAPPADPSRYRTRSVRCLRLQACDWPTQGRGHPGCPAGSSHSPPQGRGAPAWPGGSQPLRRPPRPGAGTQASRPSPGPVSMEVPLERVQHARPLCDFPATVRHDCP